MTRHEIYKAAMYISARTKKTGYKVSTRAEIAYAILSTKYANDMTIEEAYEAVSLMRQAHINILSK